MAQNPDFKKIKMTNVKLLWPRLDQIYRYDQAEKRTVACAATAPNAGWSCTWEMPIGEAKDLYGILKEHYNDSRTRKPTLPEFKHVFGMKRDDANGVATFTAKRTAVTKDGKPKTAPRVADGTKHGFPDLADKAIWSGSVGGLIVWAVAATDPKTGEGGISLQLDSVVVTDAQYGGDDLASEFEVAAPKAPSLDDFDGMDAPAQPAAKPLSQQAAAPAPKSDKVPEDAAW